MGEVFSCIMGNLGSSGYQSSVSYCLDCFYFNQFHSKLYKSLSHPKIEIAHSFILEGILQNTFKECSNTNSKINCSPFFFLHSFTVECIYTILRKHVLMCRQLNEFIHSLHFLSSAFLTHLCELWCAALHPLGSLMLCFFPWCDQKRCFWWKLKTLRPKQTFPTDAWGSQEVSDVQLNYCSFVRYHRQPVTVGVLF